MYYKKLCLSRFLYLFLILFIPFNGWSSTPAKVDDNSDSIQPLACKLIVKETGIYRITYDDLLKYDINPNLLDLSKISIQNKGNDIPIYTSRKEGSWSPQDYVEFYATSLRNEKRKKDLYSLENVYWLVPESPTRKPVLEISPSSFQQHQNNININQSDSFNNLIYLENEYMQRFHAVDWGEQYPHLWYWLYFRAPDEKNIPFSLPYVSTDSKDSMVQIRIGLQGETRPPVSPAHHAEFRINDVFIGEAFWDGRRPYTFVTTVPYSLLTSVQNELLIHAPGDINFNPPMDIFYLEYVEFQYQKKYIADAEYLIFQSDDTSAKPLKSVIHGFKDKNIIIYDITGGRRITPVIYNDPDNNNLFAAEFIDSPGMNNQYIAYTKWHLAKPLRFEPVYPSDIKNLGNSADYVILAYDDFIPELKPLVDWREKQGHKVKIVKITDVYNEFNHGFFNPEAIRSFVEYAYKNWSEPKMKYLFLVGDANWDYKGNLSNYMKMTVQNYIPTYLYLGRLSYMECDNYFVNLETTAPYPTIAVGRLTARSKEDVRGYVEKILKYESSDSNQFLKNNALLIAGEGAMFTNDLDYIAVHYLTPTYAVEKAYTLPPPELTVGDVDLITKNKILHAFNNGYPLIYYSGHGSSGLWSDRKLLTLEDIEDLTSNISHIAPIVLSMTCLTGGFSNPDDTSGVCELMVRLKEGGAIAAYGASGRASVGSDTLLGRGILKALIMDNIPVLGDAILKGLRELHSSDVDMINMYNLFGDPALKVQLPKNNVKLSVKRDIDSDDLVVFGHYDKVSNANVDLEFLNGNGQVISTGQLNTGKPEFTYILDSGLIEGKELKYIRCSLTDNVLDSHEMGWMTVDPDLLKEKAESTASL